MPKKKKTQERIMLLNGCSVSRFSVIPQNWDKPGANPNKEWMVHYTFYDPAFNDDPKIKGFKRCKARGGINKFKTLDDKRLATQETLAYDYDMIVNKHYNPITETFMNEPRAHGPAENAPDDGVIISPDMPFIEAFLEAYNNISLNVAESTAYDIKSVINGMREAAKALQYIDMPIKAIERRHIMKMLNKCREINPRFTNKRYNRYRSYLLTIYKELVAVQAVPADIIEPIPILTVMESEPKEHLTMDERMAIDVHLKANNYPFWLFTQLFYYSGAREVEIMNLKVKDVDIKDQKLRIEIKKGKKYKVVYKTIRDIAVPLWELAIKDARSPEDYVFSKGLVPGDTPISARQITLRWKRWVKSGATYRYRRNGETRIAKGKGLGINKDFYSLRGLSADEIDKYVHEQLKRLEESIQFAAAQTSHTSTKITINHYATNHKERQHKVLKKASNTFVPV